MKNLFLVIIGILIPSLTFAQKSITLDLSQFDNTRQENVVNRKLESEEVIKQLENIGEVARGSEEVIKLNVVSGKTTKSYDMKRVSVAPKMTLKIGNRKRTEHSYFIYRGMDGKDKEDMTTVILREDGQLYFSKKTKSSSISLIKNVEGLSVPVYNYFIEFISNDDDEKCHLNEDHIDDDGRDKVKKMGDNFDGLFYIELGVACDYEFYQYKGFSTSIVENTLLDRAATVHNLYIDCDMRVHTTLIDMVIETSNDAFFNIPKCFFNNSRIDAFVGNQVFASSPYRPLGDVLTLFSGSELRGALCINNIGGMANLINGACGYRRTNLVEYDNGGYTWAHEVGHNIGIGINHGNIPNGYFYGDVTPIWHPNTIDKVHDKMMDKDCIIKKDCDESDSPNFTISTSCNDGNWTVTVTANDQDPANHWWGLMVTDTQGAISNGNTIEQIGTPKSGISATFEGLDQSKRYYIKHGIWEDCCYSWKEKRIAVPVFNTNPEFHFENASGTTKTSFCGEDDIYLDGTASTGENKFHLSAWRRPFSSSSFSWYGSIGWTNGTVGIENLTDLFAADGMYFYEGYEYRIKLATMNLNECRVWTEELNNFTVLNCCYPYACRTAKRRINKTEVYPNPASDIVNIKLDHIIKGDLVFNLYSTTGELVTQKSFSGETSAIEIPLEETPTGLYLVQVKHNNEVIHIQKLSIVK